jgi:class III poly(R)-hydroxyalkanoic acid synthase PhaE subunit
MDFSNSMFSLWMDLPGKLSEQWSKLYKNFSPSTFGFNLLKKSDEPQTLPFDSLGLYEEWMRMSGDTIQRVLQMAPAGGVGPETFSRVFDGMKSYFALYEFWNEWVKVMAPFGGRTPSVEEWKVVHEKMSQEYGTVIDTILGKKPPETMEEIMKLQGKLMGQGIEFLSWFRTPWTTIMRQLPQVSSKAMTGDISAVREGFSLWQTAVSDTLGKLLHIPSLGYSRQYEEKQKELVEAYVKFATSLPAFYGEFHQAGMKALDKLLERIKDIPAENTPESFRKFYGVWLKTNEDTFYDLFKRDEFVNMMNEVMKRGLDFKKKLDTNVSRYLESFSIPNREEMNDVYRTLYELKREVRQLTKNVQELMDKKGA